MPNRFGMFVRDWWKFILFAVAAVATGPVSIVVALVIGLISLLQWSI